MPELDERAGHNPNAKPGVEGPDPRYVLIGELDREVERLRARNEALRASADALEKYVAHEHYCPANPRVRYSGGHDCECGLDTALINYRSISRENTNGPD